MMRKRQNQVLVGLLVVQAILVVVVFWPRPATTGGGQPLLTGFQGAAAVGLTIADGSGNSVELRQVNGVWVLPQAGDYPALATPVDTLLTKLAGLTDRRLITRTAASHKQLQVAADAFLRQVDIELADGTRYRLYIGSSPGYGTAHVRLDGHDETYMGELTSGSAEAQLGAWVDLVYLNVTADTVTGLTVQNAQGTLQFTKDEQGTWALAGLAAGQTLDPARVQTLLQQVTVVRMLRPLGQDNRPEYSMDSPGAVVTLKTADKEITLTIGAPDPADSSYVVRSSESPYYVRVAGSSLKDVVGKGADGYLAPPPTPTTTPSVP
jgi:hypothetical protein